MNVEERIKQFIGVQNLTASASEKEINASDGYINSISKNIGIDKLNTILEKYPKLNVKWLITRKGEMLKSGGASPLLPRVKTIKPTKVEGRNLVLKVIAVDDHDNDRIPLVLVHAQTGYLNGYDDRRFIEQLLTYSLPTMQNGAYRMSRVSGLSMYPTLQDNSYVVGKFVKDWDILSNSRVCVVVMINDGVTVKHVVNSINKYGTLYCKSGNHDYPHLPIHAENVKEVWERKTHLSSEFLDPVASYQEIAELEANVAHLKGELAEIRKLASQKISE